MSSVKLSPYIVQELPDIGVVVNDPIKSAQRVKYTCFDVSKSFIVFGATSGGLYVFTRQPCEFTQLIPNKDGAVTRLSISPDEKRIAFANGRGIVTVTSCEQAAAGHQSVIYSKEHQDNEVSAMVWGSNLLFIGDDVGSVSVLQMSGFITKTIFQGSSQTIMTLDSRICQLDIRDCMLLVSTLSRCYICDTSKEVYRQIGQKLRDGEFGACFVTTKSSDNGATQNRNEEISELKKYIIVDVEHNFAVNEKFSNTLIYSARPSSRLWEATVDGTVLRTHQYKQVLGKSSVKVITIEEYLNENVSWEFPAEINDSQSCNFAKLFNLNGAIFAFKKDALYFLNTDNVEYTLWVDSYEDILDCKLYNDNLYIWRQNGSLISLKYVNVTKYLAKCYFDTKYVLCAEMCALFSSYLLSDECEGSNLHFLVGLRDKLNNNEELISKISNILEKCNNCKGKEATRMKSGIYVVDNTYHAQCELNEDHSDNRSNSKRSSPEPLQALKEIGSSMSDKITNSTKILKERLVDLEEKVKSFSIEKDTDLEEVNTIQKDVIENDIIYKESSQKAIDMNDNGVYSDVCKALYQQYRLSLTNKELDKSNIVSAIDDLPCDINDIYELMKCLEKFCTSVQAYEESKFVPNIIFLTYVSESKNKDQILDLLVKNEQLYTYFVDSCISVNMKTQRLTNLGCQCGYPLPYTRTNKVPEFSQLIDDFIERQWMSKSQEQCYEMCKRMPYLWKKILYLRKNEDLMNILRLLLQMLDEKLLHTFLPQFTLDTWERAVQLYATLHRNMCLNCNKKFDNICIDDALNWDGLGALIIKSIGGRNAAKIVQKHADLIGMGDITMRFYHSCILSALFEKYDGTVTEQLVNTIYSVYEFDDSREAVCDLLSSAIMSVIRNTSLPLIVAAKSHHWGLHPLTEEYINPIGNLPEEKRIKNASLNEVLHNLCAINNNIVDCALCGLPLVNEVLIQDGGLWAFKCGHVFHGACLNLNGVKLCPSCVSN